MSDLEWTAEGAPRSRRFEDVYFSRADGLAESRAVFLAGCGLPDAWRGRDRFVVGELGFGTGLNVLALLDLWRRTRPAGGRLHVFSVEGFPLSPEDAARALQAWPELAELAAPLLRRWPQAVGVRRVDWPELAATLDVVVADVAPALEGWDGRADAWFLDGFSPAKNPDMWTEAVFAHVAARSAPGARLATFTVAGAVRRGLTDAGFAVERRPGHGAKRQRLEAVLVQSRGHSAGLARSAHSPLQASEVLVIGGGVAGASVVRALRAQGFEPTVLAGTDPGASGNPAALVTPRYEVGDTPAARLYAQAFRRAVDLYGGEADVVLSRGVRQLGDERTAARHERLSRAPWFGPGELRYEPESSDLIARDALVIDPRRLTARWLDGVRRVQGRAAALAFDGAAWSALDADGGLLARAETVVLASGFSAAALAPGLPLQAVRGQVSLAPGVEGPAAAWGGYCAPTPDGLLFGSTHDRGVTDDALREEDHARNLATLAERLPAVAAQVRPAELAGRASVRAATPDRLPMAGPVPGADGSGDGVRPGLWIVGGLGSRGFTTAPLLAEHVVAWMDGAPSPLPLALAAAVDPARFLRRARRRGRTGPGEVS